MKKFCFFLVGISLLLSACNAPVAKQDKQLPIDTQPRTDYSTESTLVVCLEQEPDTLHPLYASTKSQPILQSLYDGPIDQQNFSYEAIILTKLPTLNDGDAAIQTFSISENERIVDTFGAVTALIPGTQYRPAGCQSNNCALTYEGGNIEMNRMLVSFNLREDVFWSDGTPVTAKDSVLGYQLLKTVNPATEIFLLARTDSYESIGPYTTVWIGLPGYLDRTFATNFFMPLPAHQLEGASPAEVINMDAMNRSPIGWGAYLIESWNPGISITLHKNPFYFRAIEGLPLFDTLVYRFVGQDRETAIDMLRTGECDMLDVSINLEDHIEALIPLENTGEIKLHSQPSASWEQLVFGIQHSDYDDGYQIGEDRPVFFKDVRVRQAIAHCINREEIADRLTYGYGSVLHTYLPASHPLYNEAANTYTHDIDVGMNLLEEVGWRIGENGLRVAEEVEDILDGTEFSLTYWTNDTAQRRQIAESIRGSLAACGIEINIEYRTDAELFAAGPDGSLFGRHFDLAQFNSFITTEPLCNLFTSDTIAGAPNIPIAEVPWLNHAPENIARDAFPLGWQGWNVSGYANPDYDKACYTALNSISGQLAYDENHRLAQAIFAEELPVLPLYTNQGITATRSDLCALQANRFTTTNLWHIETIGYGSACP